MRCGVIGGTCLIGAQVVKKLNAARHEAVPHSMSTGVDVISELGRLTPNARSDGRTVVTDDTVGMLAAVHGDALIAKGDTRIAPTHYSDWLS
ncbi:hypothetical protein [Streptomyces sp. NPDC101165]|uniref:hypothetical protein n=1 Tax=Streptomyces sp. NPDC101165 TaxID=3366119 RepID=UPI0037F4124E